MSCRRATQMISESLDRKLSRTERVALRIHLVVCRSCCRYRRQLHRVRAALAGLGEAHSGSFLTPEAKRRIRESLASAIE